MAMRHLLQLDAGRADIIAVGKEGRRQVLDFPADAEGADAFAQYLALHPDQQYVMVADVADEACVHEQIPPVRGRSRARMIQRKLEQAFHGAPLSVACSLGYVQTGRGDERLLLLCLTQSSLFAPWFAALRQGRARLSGLYSSTQLVAVLAERLLPAREAPFLLLTLGRAGIRLSYFEDGKLHFSHLGMSTPDSTAAMAAACAQEANRVIQYLQGQRFLSRQHTRLTCLTLLYPEQREDFATHCPNTAQLKFQFLDIGTAYQAAGLPIPPSQAGADPLLQFLAVVYPPQAQFAPASERHFHLLRQQRHLLLGGAGLFLLLALIAASVQLYQARTALHRAHLLDGETQRLTQEHQAHITALAPMSAQPENLRGLIRTFRALERDNAPLARSLVELSRSLSAFPDVQLQRLDWRLQSKDASQPNLPGDHAVELMLRASLPHEMPPQHQVETTEAFVAALKQVPEAEVTLLERTFGMDPAKVLRSHEAPSSSTMPEFSLRLRRLL